MKKLGPTEIPRMWDTANPVLNDKLKQIIRQVNLQEWLQVRKLRDETRTNNDTCEDDEYLFFPCEAGKKYAFRLSVFFDTGATSDFKYRISGPASPDVIRYRTGDIAPSDPTHNVTVQTTTLVEISVTSGAGTDGGYVNVEGIIHTNSTDAGKLSFQWAQDTADGGESTTVRAGSWLEWMAL